MMYFEINFDDLKEEVQKELLDYYGIDKPEDENLNRIPLVILEIGD